MIKSIKKIGGNILSVLAPGYWKSYAELSYWKKKKQEEGEFSNRYYRYFYTEHFNLTIDDYTGKRVLDIGCGPRGSLEWADMAKERVGLDPLAESYLKLGADQHNMEYVTSGSEAIPFADEYFDVVCSFNSLDHVENVEETIKEIKRVTAPKGCFLLMVEINHKPTNCEPHEIKPDIVDGFAPEFSLKSLRIFPPVESGLYDSVKLNEPVDNPLQFQERGWLSAAFTKLPDSAVTII